MKHLTFRPYAPGDEEAILGLFSASFGARIMSSEYWNWRFRDNPVGRHYIELAWDREKLVGHYAISPVVVTLLGQDVLTALSGTSMIHPDCQRMGLFSALGDRLYKRLDEHGFLSVWGFPNIKSHRPINRDLKWQDVREIPYFEHDLSDATRIREVDQDIEELPGFDSRFDELWNSVKFDHTILVRRDRDYLRWRFTTLPDDGYRTYRILAYVHGSRILGYAVFNTYLEQYLQIVDLLTVNELRIGVELVNAAIVIARQENRRTVRMWLPVEHPLHWQLESQGFEGRSPLTFFGTRLFTASVGTLELAHLFRWYSTMSDSDVF